MSKRVFRLPGLGHKMSILTLGFTCGLALGLLWERPVISWDSGIPTAIKISRRGLTHLQRQLLAIKNNSALARVLRSPVVMAKVQSELSDKMPEYAAVIFCVVDMFTDTRLYPNVDLQVNATWGRHCNHLLFVTNDRDWVRPGLTMFVEDNDSMSARRTTFRHLQQANVSRDAEWFLWSPMMSFAIVENLRYLVHDLNTSEPAYLGPLWTGARIPRPSRDTKVFAFNRAALDRIVKTNCSGSGNMARCWRTAGVKVLDSRDDQGCARFLEDTLSVDTLPFRHVLSRNPPDECLSITFVSVQTVAWLHAALYEYLTHVVTPYGLRARLNVADALMPWNASNMPTWETKLTTTTQTGTTTHPIQDVRQTTPKSTSATAISHVVRRSFVATNNTQKPSTTEASGTTPGRSSVAFKHTQGSNET